MANTTKTPSERALHTFRLECADHEMEIRHDDGPAPLLPAPGTGMYWYDLITTREQLTSVLPVLRFMCAPGGDNR